jgi:hypothetical protein
MSMSRLLAVFVTPSSTEAALVAVKQMEAKGLLKIEGDRVKLTPTRPTTLERTSRAGRSARPERTAR